jgi:hypothetical protein
VRRGGPTEPTVLDDSRESGEIFERCHGTVLISAQPCADNIVLSYTQPVDKFAFTPTPLESEMNDTAATVQTTIRAPRAHAFGHIVPIDLASIFTGYGPLPSVSKTLNATGAWDAAGRSRTVVFSDGSSASESLTGYDFPNGFSYRITGFTGALKYLASEAHGQWWFEGGPDGATTSVRWRYEFVSRFKVLEPLARVFTHRLWRGYMGKALGLAKGQVEGSAGAVA